jgi:hypothetical protein
MANSVRSSKKPRTIWSSRGDSSSERAISAHACSLNIVELGACRRERASLRLFARLFTTPGLMSHGKAAVLRVRFCRYSPPIRLKSKPLSVVGETPTRLGSQDGGLLGGHSCHRPSRIGVWASGLPPTAPTARGRSGRLRMTNLICCSLRNQCQPMYFIRRIPSIDSPTFVPNSRRSFLSFELIHLTR